MLGGNEFDRLVTARCPHICQLLTLQHIDLKIIVAVMFTNNHSLINRCLWIDKHKAAILQIEKCVGHSDTSVGGDQRSITPSLNIAPVRRIGVKNTVQHTGAACLGEESALIPDQAT